MSSSEHWFDRLAAPHTRRQGFKAAVAGALLTLPFARSDRARASHDSCHQPCLYTAHRRKVERNNTCNAQGEANILHDLSLLFTFVGQFALALEGKDVIAARRCHENALALSKADAFDCLQAGCGGFVPDPNVLCPGCTEAGGRCCPAPSSGTLSGYLCCPCCADNGDGCKSPPC